MFPIANAIRLRYPRQSPLSGHWDRGQLYRLSCMKINLSQSQLDQFLPNLLCSGPLFRSGLLPTALAPSLLAYLPFVSNMFLHAGWLPP